MFIVVSICSNVLLLECQILAVETFDFGVDAIKKPYKVYSQQL